MSLLSKINRELFALMILTLPLQVNVIIYQTAWGKGLMNPFTSIWLTLTEVIILVSALLLIISRRAEKKKLEYGGGEFLFIFLFILFSFALSIAVSPFEDNLFHIFLISKLFSLFLLYLIVVNKVLKMRDILKFFIIGMSFQAVLALFQFTFQTNLGLHFIGEPILSVDVANLARIKLGSLTLIRPYGTFPHPNILGGFLVVSLLLTLLFYPNLKYEKTSLFIIQFLALLVAFSRTSLIALFAAMLILVFWYLKNVQRTVKSRKGLIIKTTLIASILLSPIVYIWFNRALSIFQDASLAERILGAKYSILIFLSNPLGVGFSHFTLFLDSAADTSLLPWQYQPVHNVFLLVLSETGIIGLTSVLILIIFIFKTLLRKRKKLLKRRLRFKKRVFLSIALSLLIIIQFDHYLISLDQGRFLLVILFGIFTIFSANPRHILPLKKGGKFYKILDDQ